MIASDAFIGAQVLTFAIPLGTLCAAILVGYFVRKRES